MPEYLNFGSRLSELEPEEAEEQLLLQLARLQEALARLKESEKISSDLFSRVVSV